MTVTLRRRLPGVLAILAVLAVGLGGVAQATASRSHHHHHHRVAVHHHSKIPQHDGGDQDADNNGGPSDGDGNL